jgi:thiol-disulfide isomerase/thioredoxin
MTKAPPLIGDTWFGVLNPRIGIEDFKGRFLLLDFWTLCCVNCHHVLAELRPLEEKFSEVLTVVGVHSPKFEHEKLPESVAAAISRHDITHPVLNDPNMTTWENYGVRAWPTLVLIDPIGNVISTYSGEGHAHAIEALLDELIPKYLASGELVPGKGLYQESPTPNTVLKGPGKVTAIPARYRDSFLGADLLVSNSGAHNLMAFSSSDTESPIFQIGSGGRGASDGTFTEAQFLEPYGAKFLSAELASNTGVDLVIADTVNHLIRGVNLKTQTVTTLAGTGKQWMQKDATEGAAVEINLSTPWDVEEFDGKILIAMAGEHRIWELDIEAGQIRVLAGTSNEGLVDGRFSEAWFAQPSALMKSRVDSSKLWLIDAETSALRYLKNETVHSVVGKGLFDFGHVDGLATEALLQHPLGLLELPSGEVLIADSYNKSIRKYSPEKNAVTTIARDLSEPSDIELVETSTGPKLAIVEAAANRLTLIPISGDVLVSGDALRTSRPALEVRSGGAVVDVIFEAPPGQKLDDRFGPSTHLVVSSTPKELLIEGAGSSSELRRRLVINPEISEGVLHVAAKGASCDESEEFAQCHIHQQDWGVPVRVSETGTSTVTLVLSGA